MYTEIVLASAYLFLSSTETETDLECFDIELHTNGVGNGWRFGHCQSSQEYVGTGTYTEKCCLSRGPQILSCTSFDSHGWGRSFVLLLGHRFCDDHVGYKAMSMIDVFGRR